VTTVDPVVKDRAGDLRAELARLEAEEAEIGGLLDLVFDHLPHGVVVGAPDGTLKLNPAGAEILGALAENKGTEAWADQYGLFREDGTPYQSNDLPLVRAMRGEIIESAMLRMRTKAKPEGVWLRVSARPLPDGTAVAVFRDVTRERDAREAVEKRAFELAERDEENQALVERLRLTLDALSTPVLEIANDVLAVPVIGVVDTERSAVMSERILSEVVRTRSRFVVIDLTGVSVLDTSTADRLLKLSGAVRLLGAQCVVSGIQPAVAQTLVAIGVQLDGLVPHRDLEHALEHCMRATH